MNSPTAAVLHSDSLESSRSDLDDMLLSIRQSAMSIADTMRADVVHNTKVLRTVAALLEDGLVLLDKDSRITIFNPSASSIFGINAADAIGKTFDELFPSLSNRLKSNSLLQVLPSAIMDEQSGLPVDLKFASMASDDPSQGFSPFSVLVARKPQELSDDTTNAEVKRRLEEALDLYSMTLWNFPLVVFASDMNGNNVQGSKDFYAMIGMTPEQVERQNINDILPAEYLGWYYQRDAKTAIQISMQTTGGVQALSAHKSVVHTSDGVPRGFITCMTRQPTQSTEVSFASSFIKTLDALATPLMLVSYSEGRILIVNKAFCQKYGYHREEVLNKSADFIFVNEDQTRARRRFAVNLAAGVEPVGFFQIRNAAGDLVSVRIKGIAINSDGAPGKPPKYCFLSEC